VSGRITDKCLFANLQQNIINSAYCEQSAETCLKTSSFWQSNLCLRSLAECMKTYVVVELPFSSMSTETAR
jgi:hypothetical protein